MNADQQGPWGRGDVRLRIGDAERNAASADLGEHYAQGRLTTEEHGERLDRIWEARTRGELAAIFSDLPGRVGHPAAGLPTTRPPRRRPGWTRLPAPLLALVVLLVAVTVLANLPWILIGLAVWFFFLRGACHSSHRTHRW